MKKSVDVPKEWIQVRESFISGTEALDLSKFQKFICRLFNIEPKPKYLCAGAIKLVKYDSLSKGDVVKLHSGELFYVVSCRNGECSIEGATLLDKIPRLNYGATLELFSSNFKER